MYLELAQRYLMKARSASGNTRQYFANLCQVCLAKEGKSPADIGTTPKELATLAIKSSKKRRNLKTQKISKDQDQTEACRKYLDQCRKAQGTGRQYFANLCLNTLARWGLSPESIGSSNAELQELQSKGFLESAASYLKQAREASGIKRKCYADLCWEYLEKGQGQPLDIGISKEELTELNK